MPPTAHIISLKTFNRSIIRCTVQLRRLLGSSSLETVITDGHRKLSRHTLKGKLKLRKFPPSTSVILLTPVGSDYSYGSPSNPSSYTRTRRADSGIWNPIEDHNLKTPGPLVSSAIAIFGNGSFFQTAANATNGTQAVREICSAQGVPFELGFWNEITSNYGDSPCSHSLDYVRDDNLRGLVWAFFLPWNETASANRFLDVAMHYANKALMMQALSQDSENVFISTVHSDPGQAFIKPSVSFVAMIIISVFIALQVLGILVLMIYIIRSPTWTPTLDALAVARIGAALLPETLPPMGNLSLGYSKKLDHVEGVVGIVGQRQDTKYGDIPILGLGGQGIVRKRAQQPEAHSGPPQSYNR